MTIAQEILAAVAGMRRSGAFAKGASLCWDPAELESLAMFAIDAKRRPSMRSDDAPPTGPSGSDRLLSG